MAKLTLSQAAKHAKRSKGTISKALNNGKISASKIEKNGIDTWQIEPSELQRWMEANPVRTPVQGQSEVQYTTPEKTSGNSVLQSELEAVRKELEQGRAERERERSQLTDTIEDLRRRLDEETAAHRETNKRYAALLTDQRPTAPEPLRRGLWARLTGAGG